MVETTSLRPGPRCGVCVAVAGMNDEDRATILAWFADPAMMSSRIAEALQLEGYSIRAQSVSRHRRGLCSP